MSITCPDRARGSAMVVAIFLLVVLAALGAFIAGITSSQHVGLAHDIQGARAYQAARYGSEWGVYQLLKVDTADVDNASFPYRCRRAAYAAPISTSLNGLAGSLAGFTVTVSCAAGSYNEGERSDANAIPNPVYVYRITATACSQPDAGACPNATAAVAGIGYIERRISLTVTN